MTIPYIIVGLGKTGLATANYLQRHNYRFAIADTRLSPPMLSDAKKLFPSVEIVLGDLDPDFLKQAKTLLVSPGVPLSTPAIQIALSHGVEVIGDIELFARFAEAPIIGVTGTNGKSTVVSLLGAMFRRAQASVVVAGNIGTCVLDVLDEPTPDFYILELSSFQLETTHSLQLKVASILNVTPDHMDRYADLAAYAKAKQRIYNHAENVVYNADDPLTFPANKNHAVGFTQNVPLSDQYGLLEEEGRWFLHRGAEKIIAADELRIAGLHNATNALCALAIAEMVGLPRKALCEALVEFPGLDHRLQWVRKIDAVDWYNDSKGTNVGASVQALLGLGTTRKEKIILLAGGQGKSADFTLLRDPVIRFCRDVILYGEDAPLLENALQKTVTLHRVTSLDDAIDLAHSIAKPAEAVLLSPACASFDMFQNFEHRGHCFRDRVLQLESKSQ